MDAQKDAKMSEQNGSGIMLKLSPVVLDLLTRMLTSHTYREKLGAERFKQAIDMTISPQEKFYFQRVVYEEEQHFYGCLEVGDELGINLKELINARMHKEPPGIPVFYTWLDVLLAHAFNDQAGYFVLQGLTGSSIEVYASLAARLIEEEESHGIQGAKMLIRYLNQLEKLDSSVLASILNHLDAAARCIGRPNSRKDTEAVRLHLKSRSSAETMEEFCSYADGILKQLSCENLTPLAKRYLL